MVYDVVAVHGDLLLGVGSGPLSVRGCHCPIPKFLSLVHLSGRPSPFISAQALKMWLFQGHPQSYCITKYIVTPRYTHARTYTLPHTHTHAHTHKHTHAHTQTRTSAHKHTARYDSDASTCSSLSDGWPSSARSAGGPSVVCTDRETLRAEVRVGLQQRSDLLDRRCCSCCWCRICAERPSCAGTAHGTQAAAAQLSGQPKVASRHTRAGAARGPALPTSAWVVVLAA